jgi:hypothetical protein
MALFQFTALDNTGTEKRGTIEAGTQQDAITAIQRYGLQPTHVFAVNQPQPNPWTQPAPAAMPGYAPPHVPVRSSGSFSLFLSALALVTALGALGWQLYGKFAPAKETANPLGKGLKAYNFKTPKDAYLSQLEIDRSHDILARLELDEARHGPELKEQLETTQVRKEENWKGITILFVEYQKKGVKKYLIQGYAKETGSGLWLPKYVSAYEVRKESPELANRMESWLKDGGTKPPG